MKQYDIIIYEYENEYDLRELGPAGHVGFLSSHIQRALVE